MRVASSSPSGIFRGGNWQGTAIVVISGGASLAPASYDRRLSRYISPQIEWTVVGIDERWRDGVSPSLRSSRNDRIMHGFQSHETSPFLFFWPGSQQTAYIHQLCQVIRVVIGYQQGF